MGKQADLQNVINGQNMILKGNPNITKAIVGHLLKHRSDVDIDLVFTAIDVSGNGFIDASEFEDLLTMLNFFDQIDKDKSGSLSKSEIVSYFKDIPSIDMGTELADGKVTITEFIQSMMKKVGSTNKTRIDLVKAKSPMAKEYQNAKAGKGVISKKTLKSVYSGVSSAIDVDKLLGDKDGLTFEEERMLLMILGRFMELDTDRSWFITGKEIRDYLAVTKPPKKTADQWLSMKKMDKNSDDKVSFDEFYKACVKFGSA